MFPCEAMLLISGKVGLRQTRYDSVFVIVSDAYQAPVFNDQIKRNNVITGFGQHTYTSCLDALNNELFKKK